MVDVPPGVSRLKFPAGSTSRPVRPVCSAMADIASSPLVIQTEHLAAEPAAWLAQRVRLERCSTEDERFPRFLRDAAGLVIRTYTKVDTQLLDQAPQLRVVGRAGVGLDNIDLDACQLRGVRVVHTPDANTQAVVEYVMRLILDHVRPVGSPLTQPIGDERWKTLRSDTVGSHELAELTVGILGLGRIGKRLAQVLASFGTEVLYHDLLDIPPEQRFAARPVTAAELFQNSDIVSVHIDGRPGNRHFIREELLQRLRARSLFVNASRGFVVDAHALARLLRERPSTRAILDVHDPEPVTADNPLLGLANATLFPHLASRTNTAMNNMSWVVRDVWEVLEGREPAYPASNLT